VTELLIEAAARGIRPLECDAGRVADIRPPALDEAVNRRLRRAGDDAVALARAVAVLGDGTSLPLAAAVAGLTEGAARHVAGRLAESRIFTRTTELGFMHPVVRDAVHADVAPVEQAGLHAAAAEALLALGGGRERVAAHLLYVEPRGNGEVAERLTAVGADALSRGAPDGAVPYLTRALAEPPDPGEAPRVLHLLGLAEAATQRSSFDLHLRQALAFAPGAEDRARIALDLGGALAAAGHPADAAEALRTALAEEPDPDAAVALRLEAELLATEAYGAGTASSSDRLARRLGQLEAGERLAGVTLAPLALILVMHHPPVGRAIAVALEALADDSLWLDPHSFVTSSLAHSLVWAGRLDDGRKVYDRALAAAELHGSRLAPGCSVTMRAEARRLAGDLEGARGDVEFAAALIAAARASGHPYGDAAWLWNRVQLGETLLELGDLDGADRALGDAAARGGGAPHPRFRLAMARSRLLQERGDPAASLAELQPWAETMARFGRNPAANGWRAQLARTLAASGDRGHAVEVAGEVLDDARAFDAPACIGSSLHLLGAVTGGPEGVRLLRESTVALARGGQRLERAKAAAALGGALRRAGHRAEARDHLREAIDVAARCGAHGVRQAAHDELVAAGARPRRDRHLLQGPESLTTAERRVAELAAQGLTNRQIAARLVVSVAAVQWHLRHIYRKLDVTSRDLLSAILDADRSESAAHSGTGIPESDKSVPSPEPHG
jgi:DNA-binding CsgD family transcriptional regulator/tetratricopeptide (TPR) repeat protein